MDELERLQKETRDAQKAQEKVYCKTCKFRPRIIRTGYCVPFIWVRTKIDDWFSRTHYVDKLKYGTYEMKSQNKDNACKYHRER